MTRERRQRARPSSPTLAAAFALLAAVLLLSLALVPRAEAFLYWTNQGPDTIGRANLDGSGVRQSFISDAAGPTGIAVDADHISGANGGARTIGRADIDGRNVTETLISDVGSPQGVAVGAGHIYWANQRGAIGRADIDGTNVNREFIAVPEEPTGIAVDAAHIYWGTFSGGIGRADIGGTNVDQSFLGGGGSATTGIAVNADHIYWGTTPGASRAPTSTAPLSTVSSSPAASTPTASGSTPTTSTGQTVPTRFSARTSTRPASCRDSLTRMIPTVSPWTRATTRYPRSGICGSGRGALSPPPDRPRWRELAVPGSRSLCPSQPGSGSAFGTTHRDIRVGPLRATRTCSSAGSSGVRTASPSPRRSVGGPSRPVGTG